MEIIKVAGVNYSVKHVDRLLDNYDFLGQTDYPNNEIKIDSGIGNERENQVLIHELLHAIFYESGYDEQDEDLINRVGITLHQVLKDNDFSFMNERDDENEGIKT